MQGVISGKPAKKLFRRLLCLTTSLQYSLQNSVPNSSLSCINPPIGVRSSTVPVGHLPIYVGAERERFVVNAKLLNHPIFMKLLNKSAQEYGYEQEGVLRIPCHVLLFERVLESMHFGLRDESIHDLLPTNFFIVQDNRLSFV